MEDVMLAKWEKEFHELVPMCFFLKIALFWRNILYSKAKGQGQHVAK